MNFTYPINLNLTGKQVTIIGGGKIAERKILSLLGTGAEICVVSPELTPELKRMSDEQMIRWKNKFFSKEDISGAFLVIAATSDKKTNLFVKESSFGLQLVSLVDDPEASDIHIPSVLRRGKLSIAISTSGASPILAKNIKQKLESDFNEKYTDYMEFLLECRKIILEKVKNPEKKQKLLSAIVCQDFLESNNRQIEFESLLKQVLAD
jgi:precorrin-2 dehydrogenase / sirohydrochlorin ferrochelatase